MQITISVPEEILEELHIYESQTGLTKEDLAKMALVSLIKSDQLKLIKAYRETIIEEKLFKAREMELNKRLGLVDKSASKNVTSESKLPEPHNISGKIITPKELPDNYPLDFMLDANSVQDLNPK